MILVFTRGRSWSNLLQVVGHPIRNDYIIPPCFVFHVLYVCVVVWMSFALLVNRLSEVILVVVHCLNQVTSLLGLFHLSKYATGKRL